MDAGGSRPAPGVDATQRLRAEAEPRRVPLGRCDPKTPEDTFVPLAGATQLSAWHEPGGPSLERA